MWRYEQETGRLTTPWGSPCGKGYSGHGDGLNNPKMERIAGVGPIPRGRYTICAAYADSHLGPYVMPLAPINGTNTFGRTGFLVSGEPVTVEDERERLGESVVLTFMARSVLYATSDRELEVY